MLTNMWIRGFCVFTLVTFVALATISGCDGGGGGGQNNGENVGVPPPGAPAPANLLSAADDAYEEILSIFKGLPTDGCLPEKNIGIPECNYWQQGNAFDTVIDYLIMNPSKARAFADAVIFKYAIALRSPSPCLYDDFGWWAVAAQRALEHADLWSEDQIRTFEAIATQSWTTMQAGVFVWDLATAYFDSLEPLFDGGIWNYFWTTEHVPDICHTPCDATDSNQTNICGRQNTVTNGLYLVAAAMRAVDSGDQFSEQAATREFDFLNNWFFNFQGDPGDSLLYALDSNLSDGPAVVRERVSTYANGGQDFHFMSDLVWAGDQGLILGGLLRYTEAVPAHRDAVITLAMRITDGVLEYLSDGTHFFPWSNVIDPTPSTIGGSPSGDDNDYNEGIGVYMRYLLYAYLTNNRMRQHLQDTGYPELVRMYAEDFAAQDKGLCYPSETSCTSLVKNTNKLAALVAALGMR
jgi:hypothetical protein